MTAPSKFPFTVHSLAPEGINIVTRAQTAFTADSVMLYPGDSYEITESIYALNVDRNGDSWLDATGPTRFGIGETPQHVKDSAEAARIAQLRAERDNLLHVNPHLAKSTAASRRLAELDAAIGKK